MRTAFLICVLAFSLTSAADAQLRGRAAVHAGKVHRTPAHQFEVVFLEDTVRIYLCDAEGNPVSARGIRGRANLAIVRATTGGARRGVGHQATGAKLSYLGASKKKGRLRDCLVAKHSLGKAQRQGVRVDVQLSGVADEPKGVVEFRVEFAARTRTPEWACAKEGCSPRVYIDPGSCPACDVALRRRGIAERRRANEGR